MTCCECHGLGCDNCYGAPRKYKEGTPYSRIAVATNGGLACTVLYGIGEEYEDYVEMGDLADALKGCFKDRPGVWVVEIWTRTRCIDTEWGKDCDTEVVVESERKATDEEIRALDDAEHPWPPGLWLEG